MNKKVKSRLMIAGAALCAALFLFSGAMLAREYLDQNEAPKPLWKWPTWLRKMWNCPL